MVIAGLGIARWLRVRWGIARLVIARLVIARLGSCDRPRILGEGLGRLGWGIVLLGILALGVLALDILAWRGLGRCTSRVGGLLARGLMGVRCSRTRLHCKLHGVTKTKGNKSLYRGAIA